MNNTGFQKKIYLQCIYLPFVNYYNLKVLYSLPVIASEFPKYREILGHGYLLERTSLDRVVK